MQETRANTGHAVLRSTTISPKMKRRNGPTERRSDGRTDRPSYRDARTHLKQEQEQGQKKKDEEEEEMGEEDEKAKAKEG